MWGEITTSVVCLVKEGGDYRKKKKKKKSQNKNVERGVWNSNRSIKKRFVYNAKNSSPSRGRKRLKEILVQCGERGGFTGQ